MSSSLGNLSGGKETCRPAKTDMNSANLDIHDENREHNREQIRQRNDSAKWSTESVAGSSVAGDSKERETLLGGHKATPSAGSRSGASCLDSKTNQQGNGGKK